MAVTETHHQPLSTVLKGKVGIVSHFTDQHVASKMMAMGILPGCRIELIRYAPFGGGCYIKADKHYLALRKQEAACIIMR